MSFLVKVGTKAESNKNKDIDHRFINVCNLSFDATNHLVRERAF